MFLLPILSLVSLASLAAFITFISYASEGSVPEDVLETVVDMREHDVPYHIRVSIDKDLRTGAWYVS